MQYKIVHNRHLKEFLQYSENLTDLYHVNRNEFDEKWIDIKSSIANSIITLYKFSNQLFKSEKFKNKEIRHYAFYLDLILSKLRHYLFTETPKKSFVDIHIGFSSLVVGVGLGGL